MSAADKSPLLLSGEPGGGVPQQAVPGQAVPGPDGHQHHHRPGGDPRPGGGVRLRQDHPGPRRPGPGPGHRRKDRSSRATTSATPTRKQRRHAEPGPAGGLPGPVHLAEPGPGDRRHPGRTPRGAGHGTRRREEARQGTAGPGGPAVGRDPPAAARVQRRPAPARGDRPGAGPRPPS